MQPSYNVYSLPSKKGQLADSGFHDIVSRLVSEAVEIGRAVVRVVGDVTGKLVRLPRANKSVSTFTGTFTAGSIKVTVAGVQVTAAWATDLDTTLALLAVAAAAVTGVSSATYDAATNVMTITIANGVGPVAADFDLSGVTGTLAVASVLSSSEIFHGIAVTTDALVADLTTGVVQYTPTGPQTANILRRGRMYVYTETAMTTDSQVFVRIQDDGSDVTKLAGNFRTDSASGKATLWADAQVVTGASAGGLAVIEINLP